MKTRLTLFFAIPAASLLLLSMLLHAQPKTDPEQHPGRYQLTSGTYGTWHPSLESKPVGDGTKGTRRPYIEEMLARPAYQAKIAEAIRFNTDYTKLDWYTLLVLQYGHRPTWDETIRIDGPFPVQGIFKIDTTTGRVWQFSSFLNDDGTIRESWRELPN